MADKQNQRGRVKSVEQGISLLKVLAASPGAMSLKHIAVATDMAPSKIHRYLVSLVAGGMVEQDHDSGQYRLGTESLQIGLAALTQLDLVRQATSVMEKLCSRLNQTILLSVWGTNGPIIIKMCEPHSPITVHVRVGFSLPLLSSATGHIFCTYMPPEQLKDHIIREFKLLASTNRADMPLNREQLDKLTSQIKKRGISCVKGVLLPGVNSLSTPIFDYRGQFVAALTALGAGDEINIHWSGPVASGLQRVSTDISHRLGFKP